jgi:serine/threonine protein kinase/tetratricopeptide (TPR) repeat protein
MPAAPPDIHAIFNEAVARESDEDRLRYLDEVCREAPDVRWRVEALLRAHSDAGGFFGGQATIPPPTEIRAGAEQPGDTIGPYKLLQQIGEGGMGVVYMAEQTEPVERRVALKIIKPGMDTRQVIARFEAERQALAMMDHPNIARVLDAGTTGEVEGQGPRVKGQESPHPSSLIAHPSSRPYFVMELVKGVPITQYCDEHQLTPRERLELFLPVCQAVQHAHQKGIIHRDLKPSNILVSEYDDRPVPKVIDFGVAKAVSQRLTERTMFTQYGQIVGTLEYMSPEQAKLNELDVDTRSDVYALGVLLYELLTGVTPFDKSRLRSAAFDELLRIIREEEPPRPSTRLSSSQTLPSIAANRKTEPKKLSTLVRGELDWIVMRALEKDRVRRYETANAFAADIQRYLCDEPVTACPPSAGYRLRKFARRNKGAIAAGGIVALSLVIGTGVATWQAWRATRERDRAVAAERVAGERLIVVEQQKTRIARERDRATEAERRANEEAAIATAVNEFVRRDLLAQADPGMEPDRDIKLRTVLDRAAADVGERFASQPLVEAAVRNLIGNVYRSLGLFDVARPHLERALELRRANRGEEHIDTLASMHNLAGLLQDEGRYDDADPLIRKTLEISRRVVGEEHSLTLTAMQTLASNLHGMEQFKKAEALYLKTLEVQQRVLGEENTDTLLTINNLGDLYQEQGRFADAERLFARNLEILRRGLGEEHPRTLLAMHNLAFVYSHFDRVDEAEKLYLRFLEVGRRVQGAEHPDVVSAGVNLAKLYVQQSRFAEAEELYLKSLEIGRRVLNDEHRVMIYCLESLAEFYGRQGRPADAEPHVVRLLEVYRRRLGEEHPRTLQWMNNLGVTLQGQGRFDEAEALLQKILDMKLRVVGDEDPGTLATMCNLAFVRALLGRQEEAEKLFDAALATERRVFGAERNESLRSLTDLAVSLKNLGKHSDAESWLVKALEMQRRVRGATHPDTLDTMHELAAVYGMRRNFDGAQALLEELLAVQRQNLPSDSVEWSGFLALAARNLIELERFSEAEAHLRDCLAIRESKLPGSWRLTYARVLLGAALAGQNDFTEAEPLLTGGFADLDRLQTQIPEEVRAEYLTWTLDQIVAFYEARHADGDSEKLETYKAMQSGRQPTD